MDNQPFENRRHDGRRRFEPLRKGREHFVHEYMDPPQNDPPADRCDCCDCCDCCGCMQNSSAPVPSTQDNPIRDNRMEDNPSSDRYGCCDCCDCCSWKDDPMQDDPMDDDPWRNHQTRMERMRQEHMRDRERTRR